MSCSNPGGSPTRPGFERSIRRSRGRSMARSRFPSRCGRDASPYRGSRSRWSSRLLNPETETIHPVVAPGIFRPGLERAGPGAEGAQVDVEAIRDTSALERKADGARARGGDARPRAKDVLVLVSAWIRGLTSDESVRGVLRSGVRGP